MRRSSLKLCYIPPCDRHHNLFFFSVWKREENKETSSNSMSRSDQPELDSTTSPSSLSPLSVSFDDLISFECELFDIECTLLFYADVLERDLERFHLTTNLDLNALELLLYWELGYI